MEQFIRRASGQFSHLLTGKITALSRASACPAQVRLLGQRGVRTPRAPTQGLSAFCEGTRCWWELELARTLQQVVPDGGKLMFIGTSKESRSLRMDCADAELVPIKRHPHTTFYFIPTTYG